MKKLLIGVMSLCVILISCNKKNPPVINENGEYLCLETVIVDSVDKVKRNYNSYVNNTCPHNRKINNEYFLFYFSPEFDSILYRGENDVPHGFNIPFKRSDPLSRIYVHTFDSIFVFIEASYAFMYNRDYDDLYLIDSSGNILESYSFKDIPGYFDGESNDFLQTVQFESIHKELISGNKMLINFIYYRYDTLIDKRDLSLVYELDLKTKELTQLPITASKYRNYKDFNFFSIVAYSSYLDENNIVYSFKKSPNIFKYNKINQKHTVLYNGNSEFFKCNEGLSDLQNVNWEYPNLFTDNDYIFRQVTKRDDSLYNYKYITQVFNKDFQLLGYEFETYVFSTNDNYHFVKSGEDKRYFLNLSGNSKYLSREQIEKEYFTDELKDLRSNIRYSGEDPLNYRTNEFLNKLKKDGYIEQKTTTAIMFGSKISCVHCIDYICEAVATTIAKQKGDSFKLIVFGESDAGLNQFFNGTNKIDSTMFTFIDNKDYQKYFTPKEDHLYYYINLEKKDNDIIIVPMDSLHYGMISFMEKNDIDYVLKTQ